MNLVRPKQPSVHTDTQIDKDLSIGSVSAYAVGWCQECAAEDIGDEIILNARMRPTESVQTVYTVHLVSTVCSVMCILFCADTS